tara:strand:- start:416 stop:883 length:468 start_codon:yes stop_codon:yes gene_type:complete
MGELIDEVLAKLRAMTGIEFATVWNNQFQYIEDGESWSFPMPCAFVEIDSSDLTQLLGSIQGSDLNIKIHIGQNVLNGVNMDENLTIFALRDLVVKEFNRWKPTTGSEFMKIAERQDYSHTNVYHYEIDFKTHYIDVTAAPAAYYTTGTTNLIIN